MAEVEIYTSAFCGYCHRAKRLLAERGAAFTEIDVMAHPERRPEMVARAGGRSTVPQIFIDGRHVGGCDELYALDRQGGLAPLLAAGAAAGAAAT
ncbi:MAG: glutaredoxin 3 [Dongiaceae bacterium]